MRLMSDAEAEAERRFAYNRTMLRLTYLARIGTLQINHQHEHEMAQINLEGKALDAATYWQECGAETHAAITRLQERLQRYD